MKHSFYILPLLAFSLAAYAQDEAPATAADAATPAATADAAAPEAAKEEEKIADGNIARREGEDKATDATLRLRKKIESIDKQLATLTAPSRPLLNTCKTATSRAERNLPNIDKMALEIADLQDKFNQAGSGDYEFKEVSIDERTQYTRDGEAAYKAMLVDMKEKKSKRRIGGLDKFEIMRERYQGIPEYTQAHEWYIKTLKKLEKTWKKQAAAEQTKRKNLLPAKSQAMQEADEAELAKLADKFKDGGEDIASVWYTPSPRNAAMLRNCINKVEDALRRNEKEPLDKQVGTVPTLLADCWATMDNARTCMLNGNLEEADRLLKEDASFKLILKLKSNLLPNEYREPLVKQHGDMAREVQKRTRDYKSLKASLERHTANMERCIRGDESQLDNALAQIEKERDMDSGEQTMEIDNSEDDEAKEEQADGEAEGGDAPEAPAEEESDEKE